MKFLLATKTKKCILQTTDNADERVHSALVYFGPNDGISVCLNGTLIGSELVGSSDNHCDNGFVVLGGKRAMSLENMLMSLLISCSSGINPWG